MANWKEIKQQILAGTKEDSQGESNTKEFLNSLCNSFNLRGRIPLGQHHDIAKESVGYIENFAVVQDKHESDHWNLVGDVYFHDMEIDDALKGFSYSTTVDMVGDINNKEVAAYIPFPFYNDQAVLEELASINGGVVVGAWKKKNADPEPISLLVGFVLFLAAPAYTNLWDTKIAPAFASLRKKLGRDHRVDFVQVSKGHLGETFGIYFIPSRGNSESCFTMSQVIAGLNIVDNHIQSDTLAKQKGVSLVKLNFSETSDSFELKAIEYLDGSVVNH